MLSLFPIEPASLNEAAIAFHTAEAMLSAVSSVATSVVPIMLPMAYGVSAPEIVITVVPVRSGEVSSSGRIEPETENEKLESPVALASAPRIGVLVDMEKVVVPSPLIDAVSNGVFVVTSTLADPDPEEISCPSASRTEIVIVADPVRSGDVSSSGKIIGVFVLRTIPALPTIGYPIRPDADAVSEKSAVRRADISPPFCGIKVE